MEDSTQNSPAAPQDGQSTPGKDRPTPKQVRRNPNAPKKGTMQRIAQMRTIIVAVVIVGMLTGAFAALPYIFKSADDPTATASSSPSPGGTREPITPVVEETVEPMPVAENEVVLTIDGKEYTRADVEAGMKPLLTKENFDRLSDPAMGTAQQRRLFSSSLSSYISELILEPTLKAEKISATDEEIEASYKDYLTTYFNNDTEMLKKGLDDIGLTDAGMRQQIKLPLLFEKLVKAKHPLDPAKVDEKAKALYEEQYGSGKIVSAIVVADQKAGDDALARVAKNKEDFAKVAQEISIDPNSKAQGGLIGPYKEGQFPEALDNAIKATDPGKFAGPLQTPYGFYVLKVDQAPTFDEMKATLVKRAESALLGDYWEKVINDIEAKSKITVDKRYGNWRGISKGGLEPVLPQPDGFTMQPAPAPEGDKPAEGDNAAPAPEASGDKPADTDKPAEDKPAEDKPAEGK